MLAASGLTSCEEKLDGPKKGSGSGGGAGAEQCVYSATCYDLEQAWELYEAYYEGAGGESGAGMGGEAGAKPLPADCPTHNGIGPRVISPADTKTPCCYGPGDNGGNCE